MDRLVARLERYLRATLGIAPEIVPWTGRDRVPLFLRSRYRFFATRLSGRSCMLLVDNGDREETPATIRKHIEHVRAKWTENIVYVRERMAPYNRKRLVEQKVPFIVPDNQMYLPMLGVDFREYFPKPFAGGRMMSPSAQAILIHALLKRDEDLTPTSLAGKLGYSAMTMSRALDGLESAGIGESSATGRGRARCFRFPEHDRETWRKSLPLMRSPVITCHAIRLKREKGLPIFQAGLSALAHYSLLAEPDIVVVAIGRKDWKSLRGGDAATVVMEGEPGGTIVEVWKYPPKLFAEDGRVDRLSLYLSLRDSSDERVQSALDSMMKDVGW